MNLVKYAAAGLLAFALCSCGTAPSPAPSEIPRPLITPSPEPEATITGLKDYEGKKYLLKDGGELIIFDGTVYGRGSWELRGEKIEYEISDEYIPIFDEAIYFCELEKHGELPANPPESVNSPAAFEALFNRVLEKNLTSGKISLRKSGEVNLGWLIREADEPESAICSYVSLYVSGREVSLAPFSGEFLGIAPQIGGITACEIEGAAGGILEIKPEGRQTLSLMWFENGKWQLLREINFDGDCEFKLSGERWFKEMDLDGDGKNERIVYNSDKDRLELYSGVLFAGAMPLDLLGFRPDTFYLAAGEDSSTYLVAEGEESLSAFQYGEQGFYSVSLPKKYTRIDGAVFRIPGKN